MTLLKGNLHTHTTVSDGDTSPGEVARWYDDQGYDFLVISDHNVRVATEELQSGLALEDRRLLLIPGEELTGWWQGPDLFHHLHVNGIGTTHTIGFPGGDSVSEVLEAMIENVIADGGLATVNHPNFMRSISLDQLAALRRLTHFEVYNGHPYTFSSGTAELPSMDLVWDGLLGMGRRVYGVAVDDAHHFSVWGPEWFNPGRGWVMVDADREPAAIVAALRRGDFHASTGPALVRIAIEDGAFQVAAAEEGLIEFVSNDGIVRAIEGAAAGYPVPDQGYLRVRFTTDEGVAWTQPVFAEGV